jgi:hypothetical protein
MSRIEFKNLEAIKALSVGDTFDGDSNMGGSFTYTVKRRQQEGLVLQSSSDAPWEKDQLHDWVDIKNNFFVNCTTPMHQVNQQQFQSAQKAGYLRSEDFANAIGCTEMEVARGLSRPVDVYQVKDMEGKVANFDNKHDALFVSKNLAAFPPEKTSLSMEQYLTSTVNKSIAEYLINALALKVKNNYPDLSVDQQRRTLKTELDHFINIPKSAMADIKENPISIRSRKGLGDTFSRVVDKKSLSASLRATELLNDPGSFSKKHGKIEPAPYNTAIELMINGELKPFVHQPVHNQLFVLYNEDLGTTSPDSTADLKCVIEPAINQAKNHRKKDISPEYDEATRPAPNR